MLSTPSTLATVISPPRKRPRISKHGITDVERRDLRQYWAKAPEGDKPTQHQIRIWFSAKYHPISQSTVSDSLSKAYAYLDTEKRLVRPKRYRSRQGKWPDLEAALHRWQLAINRSNNTVSRELLQEIAARFWQGIE